MIWHLESQRSSSSDDTGNEIACHSESSTGRFFEFENLSVSYEFMNINR